jgi:hypothetical protein
MSESKKLIIFFIISITIFFFLFSCRKEPFSNAKEVKMRISSAMMQAKEGDAAESKGEVVFYPLEVVVSG